MKCFQIGHFWKIYDGNGQHLCPRLTDIARSEAKIMIQILTKVFLHWDTIQIVAVLARWLHLPEEHAEEHEIADKTRERDDNPDYVLRPECFELRVRHLISWLGQRLAVVRNEDRRRHYPDEKAANVSVVVDEREEAGEQKSDKRGENKAAVLLQFFEDFAFLDQVHGENGEEGTERRSRTNLSKKKKKDRKTETQ